MELKREKPRYHTTNLEIINKWTQDLREQFEFEFPKKINLLEKTKIIKKNILHTLNMAEKLASISRDKEIFDTSASLLHIEKEIDKIKKDVISIAVFGQMSSGKSSFLNSLVGEELLTVAQERATATITVIRHIDNFEGQKDGNIEIHYKSENEIIFNVNTAITILDSHFNSNPTYASFELLTINDILLHREAILNKLSNSYTKDVKREYRKEVKENKKILELILNTLDENINNLGTTSKQNILDKNELISTDKSVFINNIIFYKEIKLLKNIELIDTPGLGSNSQLDTRKSEEFISKADIVMILTDAKEPMQKESEEDILHILQDIEDEKDNKNFFDKVFIVINKIDESENDRPKITTLINESLDDAEIEIHNNHILFISAKYEYLKRCDKQALKSFHISNRDNIQENDLEYIEKTIYDFSAAEATSKFLTENLKHIDKIFDGVERNFKENIEKIEGSIEEAEFRINNFSTNKEKIRNELEENLNLMIKDEYRKLLSMSYNLMDDELKYVSTSKYFVNKAKTRGTFKDANNDNTSEKDFKKLAKKLMGSIINNTNKQLEYNIKNDIFNDDNKQNLKDKLEKKTKEIQKKYENDYGVVLNLDEINIDTIKIKLNNNIDFEIGFLKSLKHFFNLFIWGSEDKYIDISSDKWVEYSQNEYKDNLRREIKNQVNNAKNNVQNEINESIQNIVETINNQLNQQLADKRKYLDNKSETMERKSIIQNSFKVLKNDFITKAKEQNRILFQ